MDLERFTFVLLRRPKDAPDFPEDRLDEFQEQHLAPEIMSWLTYRGSLPASDS